MEDELDNLLEVALNFHIHSIFSILIKNSAFKIRFTKYSCGMKNNLQFNI